MSYLKLAINTVCACACIEVFATVMAWLFLDSDELAWIEKAIAPMLALQVIAILIMLFIDFRRELDRDGIDDDE